MTLSQQAAILLEALDHELLRVDSIVRWADSAIVAADKPEAWLIELSTLDPSHITDFVTILHAHEDESLPLRWRVQITVLAYDAGLLSLAVSLRRLFTVVFIDGKGAERDSSDERLADALVEWDCLESDVIAPPLRARFETLFRSYLADAHEVSSLLRLKHEAVA
jgi:hypothetical protein